MSPEQGAGEPLDARSDLFSVGTMLYVMITRRHPFDAPTDYETLMLVKAGDFLPPETARPGLNPELYRVIRKAMAKAPGDRYQTAEEMLVDVEQVMRLAFRAVGQTELQRWLADLTSKDGVPPLTREGAPEPVPTTVGPLRADDGQESGLVLNLDDAVEIRSKDRPPPPPMAATDVMSRPPQFAPQDRRFMERREVRIGGGDRHRGAGHSAAQGHRRRPRVRPGRGAPAVAATPEARPHAAATRAGRAARPAPPAPATAEPAAPAPPPAAEAPPAAPAPPAPEAPAAPVKVAAAPPDRRQDRRRQGCGGRTPGGRFKDGDAEIRAGGEDAFPVVIKSDPEGTHVSTGKHVFGTTPLTLKLRPRNSYEFTFSKPGYAPLSRKYRFDSDEPQTCA